MRATEQQVHDWLKARENEHLEFKEARHNFHFDTLVKYCAALANEGGGSIVLGITDRKPRRVVGSTAFPDLERTKAGLIERLRLRISADEIAHPDGRVLVFTAPSRPLGVPVAVDGAYWMRAGENLVPMTQDRLRRIFDEASPDFSAEICPGATLDDLDPAAIENFRARWYRKTKAEPILRVSGAQLLRDAELLLEEGVTYAALILLGKRASMGRHLAQAEIIFEYRSSAAPRPANQREDFRQGLLLHYDRIWELVNLRNDLLWHQKPRNRRIAEALARCGLVERAGQGFDQIYGDCIRHGKALPDLSRTDDRFVWLTLHGTITDPDFLRFLEEVGRRIQVSFDLEDLLVLDLVHREQKVRGRLAARLAPLCKYGVLERVGRGRGTRYLLSRRLYTALGKAGAYSRQRGLDRETSKALLLAHIERAVPDGVALSELQEVLPGLSRDQVRTLVRELKEEGRIEVRGVTRAARWFPTAKPNRTQ